MPLSSGHKNKQKKWRKEAEFANKMLESKHNGKRIRNQARSMEVPPAASPIIAGLFQRAGIRMPKAEAFMKMMAQLEHSKNEESAQIEEETDGTK